MNHELLPSVHNATLPESYESAKLALIHCSKLDECKDWADKAQALASYARQSEDKEMETTAQRIRARAIRRCGELLKEVEKSQGGRPSKTSAASDTSFETRKDVAQEAGMSKRQAVTAIRVANVPADVFEDLTESAKPATVTELAKIGTTPVPVPLFEKLGMTKQAFQAGMYFRGDVQAFIKATKLYDIRDIVDGCQPKDREELRKSILEIDSFNDKLIAKL